jgi:hypothetical protein
VHAHEGARTAPGATQAKPPQDLLGLLPKVIVKGEFTADLFPEMVEEGPRAGKASELQKRLRQVRIFF